MDVRCERCKTEYEFDDARITEAGVTVRCTTCQHVFMVKKKALVVTVPVKPGGGAEASPTPLTAGPPGSGGAAADKGREWRVRQASGNVFTFRELTTLQKWIVERKVTRDDEISLTGESWKRLGNIAELASFFQVVDEAQRATVLPPQAPAPQPAAPPPPVPQAPPAPPQAAAPARMEPHFATADLGGGGRRAPELPPIRSGSAERQEPERRSGRPLLWLLLLALLGAAAWAAYTYWYLPQQQAAEQGPVTPPVRRAAKQREPASAGVPAADAPGSKAGSAAGSASGPEVPPAPAGALALDGGADADAGTGELAAEAAPGAAPDAGAPDAGTPDAGAPDAGVAAAPGRDFASYLAQGDRLRLRERPDSALFAYARAQELEPTRPEPHVGRGLALLDQGRLVPAERSFQQALRLDPKSGPALMGLAETYRAQGQKASAQRYYQQYLEVAPTGPDARAARNALERLKKD